MRNTPRHPVIDVGAAHVALARFARARSGRLELESLAVEVHAAAPGPGGRWAAQVGEVLALLRAGQRRREWCRVAVPGHLALVKLAAAPAGEAAGRADAHAAAAGAALPAPLADLVWQAAAMPGNGPVSDLLIGGGRADGLGDLGAALLAARLEPAAFVPAALALSRAYRHDYADATEPALVLDLGARSVAAVLAAPDGRLRLRTLALGGHAITHAVTAALQVDFTAAEAHKREWLETGGGATGESAVANAIVEAAAGWMQRLRFELARTLAAAAREDGWPAPARILVTGGASLWPGLAANLADGLGLPVEPYDALRRIRVAPTADPAQVAAQRHHLPLLIGLAAGSADPASGAIDLMPTALGARRRFRRRQPGYVAAALAVVAVAAGAAGQAQRALQTARREVAAVKSSLAALQQREAAVATEVADLDRLRQENARLGRWREARVSWASWLAKCERCLQAHGEVWLDRLRVLEGGHDASDAEMRIAIEGTLLELQHPPTPPGPEALARLQALLTDLAGLPGVREITDEHHDRSRPGLLAFGCTIVFAAEGPL